jgi:hypothetical protein
VLISDSCSGMLRLRMLLLLEWPSGDKTLLPTNNQVKPLALTRWGPWAGCKRGTGRQSAPSKTCCPAYA